MAKLEESIPITAVAFVDCIRIGQQVQREDGSYATASGLIHLDHAEAVALYDSLGAAIYRFESMARQAQTKNRWSDDV